MTQTITVDGDEVVNASIDGEVVEEITIDGVLAWAAEVGLDGLTVTRQDGSYTANNGDHVVSNGGTITLPTPVQDGIVMITEVETSPELTGTVDGLTDPIVLGDESAVFVSDGSEWYSVDRNQISSIPDSVIHQYRVSNFTTLKWADSVGSADMTVNNLALDTFENGKDAVFGDGNRSDAHGLASGPERLPGLQTEISVAFTVQYSNPNDLDVWWGAVDGENIFQLSESNANDGSLGEIRFTLRDANSNNVAIETKGAFDDGQPHLVVINKPTNDGNDFEIYVDDMSNPVGFNVSSNGAFDPNNYDMSGNDMAFYARNRGGSVSNYYEYRSGFFEFNQGTYSQTQRNELKRRVPEV